MIGFPTKTWDMIKFLLGMYASLFVDSYVKPFRRKRKAR
jgi:hypothetical protein